jgi:hypothetical protein
VRLQVNKAFDKYEKQLKAAKASGRNSKANQEKVKDFAAKQQVGGRVLRVLWGECKRGGGGLRCACGPFARLKTRPHTHTHRAGALGWAPAQNLPKPAHFCPTSTSPATSTSSAARPLPQKKKGKVEAEAPAGSDQPRKWNDYTVEFHFPEPTELQPPLIQVRGPARGCRGGGGGGGGGVQGVLDGRVQAIACCCAAAHSGAGGRLYLRRWGARAVVRWQAASGGAWPSPSDIAAAASCSCCCASHLPCPLASLWPPPKPHPQPQPLQTIDVDFQYPGREDFGLKDVNFGVDMGSRIAIVSQRRWHVGLLHCWLEGRCRRRSRGGVGPASCPAPRRPLLAAQLLLGSSAQLWALAPCVMAGCTRVLCTPAHQRLPSTPPPAPPRHPPPARWAPTAPARPPS